MALGADLESTVHQILKEPWTERTGRAVPDSDDVKLGNDAVRLDATVLYADMAASTRLVDRYKRTFATEIYKAYLHCAAKIIRSEAGVITSYDGDRIMAVYIGSSKNTAAARTALKINYACSKTINPAIQKQYDTDYHVQQTVGIDASDLFIARTGIRGSNDLVWIGPAANNAAKLTDLPPGYPTWITAAVYDRLAEEAKYSDGKNMWEQRRWTAHDNSTIYRSTYWWRV